MFSMYSCHSHMTQKGIEHIFHGTELDSDSLKSTFICAKNVWNDCKWSTEYDDTIFLQYVLPPQVADEPIEYYWREDIPERVNIVYQTEAISDLAHKLNSTVEVDTRPESWRNGQMGYTHTISGAFGKCDDRTILAAMTMRSYGIPAAFDFVPLWGSGNNGHSFCSVILPDNSLLVFQDKNDDGITYKFSHKTAKIYRRTFFEDHNSLIYRQQANEPIPPFFLDHRMKDVTSLHKIGSQDIDVSIKTETENRIGYLGIFHPTGWHPIAYSEIHDTSIRFSSVGNGLDINGEPALKGEDIGDGILYLPFIYTGEVTPIGDPFILSRNGIRTLCASSETEDIILHRKFPRLSRISRFAGYMSGGIIEGANNADFSDAIPLHHIYGTPASHLQRIRLSDNQPFRYIRYRKPSGTFSIAELRVFDENGETIKGAPISNGLLSQKEYINVIYDNNPLTYFEISPVLDLWVGLDLGISQKVSEVAFCPRTDDNDITPGDIYELFYWKEGWKSLGQKKATDHTIKFRKVPKGALLWLRNRTKGKEERPFTYENRKQIWW